MQRRPKKTKAERIKSKALLYGAKEIMKGERVPSCLFEEITTADKKFNSYEINSINDN